MPSSVSESSPTGAKSYDWRYIFGVALEHRRDLANAHVVAVLAVVTSVPIPLLMPLLVDEVLLGKPGTLVTLMNQVFPQEWHGATLYIAATLATTIVLRLASLLLGVWQNRSFSLIAKDVTFRIRAALLQRLQSISMAEYETLGSGGVSSRFVTDINAVDDFVGASVSKTLIAVLSLVGITGILLWMHWQLALFIMLMNPVVIYFTVILGKRVKTLKKKENSAFEIFQQALVETLDGIQQIRAANRERHYVLNVIDKARNIKTHSAAYSWKSDAANRFSFGIFLIGFDVFRSISMLMVVFSNLTIGEMMAVFGYLWFMMSPVQELLNMQYSFYAAKAALNRINELLTLKQEPHYPHHQNPFSDKNTVSIRVEGVSFAYGRGDNVLNNVNLNIKAGEKVALVGASGGGKSTLVQVILGLYPAQEGMLYFDNIPVTEIGLDVVRENVATVLQHPAMFNDTVRNNLTLGGSYTDEALWQALDVAQLKKTIESIPQQLDTVIGRQGLRLSGGQQQRLAIARMLLSNPKVVILDEATSALDTETESRLHQALRDFLKERTTLIIAHRLSAVKQADRVYVFENGHIIEEGAHEELMQGKGLYSRLYGQQV
ncbi:MAG: ABC transporter ATP-binding protein/permease [Gammaproteobacteria bacterium]|nr:ABC transporter ATP-binding protein/permease [Gammaproteobacteria bacterium]